MMNQSVSCEKSSFSTQIDSFLNKSIEMEDDDILNIPTCDSEINEFMEIDFDDLEVNQNKKYIYIDVQGFKMSRNRFMCKEFCLVDGEYIYHSFIKSPFNIDKLAKSYQRQANWSIDHGHRIKYNYGNTHIIELKEILISKVKIQNKIILVKGVKKTEWLRYMFRDCVEFQCYNIEDLNFDLTKMKKYYDVCHYHRQYFSENGPCALTNAFMLQDLCNKHSKSLDDNVRLLYLVNKRNQ